MKLKCKNLMLSDVEEARDRVYGGTGGLVPPTFGHGGHNIFCPSQHFVIKRNVVVQISCYFAVGNVSPA